MKKIGIIDSGIGGLTLLSELIKARANAHIFYISDRSNIPYGGKSQNFMLERMHSMCQKLIEKNVDAILIACNTATAQTIDALREIFHVPFIGIEPYLNYLNHFNSKDTDKLALIATPTTIESIRFQKLKYTVDPENKISVYPMKKLALVVEKLFDKNLDQISSEINQEILPLKNTGISHLILGCTHYPIIKKYLEQKLNVKTIDPAFQVSNYLINKFNLSTSEHSKKEFQANFDNSDSWQQYSINNFKFLSEEL